MKQVRVVMLATLMVLLSSLFALAQQSVATAGNGMVPPLIQFSNVATDDGGSSLSGVANITFSLYNRPQGGEPLWVETQNNVPLDSTGHYSVQLGITKPAGVPTTLFNSAEARWLGVKIDGQAEQPRALLLSVPYALKAGDAATIGGLPPSAFMMASPASSNGAAVANSASAQGISPAFTGKGTTNYIPLWLSTTKLGSSAMFQSTTGNIGVGTTTPAATLDVNGAINAATSYNLGGSAFAYAYGYGNTSLGLAAGNSTTTGSGNTAVGNAALTQDTAGYYNTAVGANALYYNSTGDVNTAVGNHALFADTTGFANTATGFNALSENSSGAYNAANGASALEYNTMGSGNIATGYEALYTNTTGGDNTATGFAALYYNNANYETAYGYAALYGNTTGTYNTAVGLEALYTNSSGTYNTATGYFALQLNNNGTNNTSDGTYTLANNSSGSYNTAIGVSALADNTTGTENTAVGAFACQTNTTGSGNHCFGYATDVATGNLHNATAIGSHAMVTVSDAVVLGSVAGVNGAKATARIGIGTTTPTNLLTLGKGFGPSIADGWTTYSSRRWKKNIEPIHNALGIVEQLRGVSYDLKDSGKHEIGVIAEEVGAVVPEVVTFEENGKDARGVDYSRLTALLIQATKEQEALIHKQQQQIRAQQAQMRAQQAQIARISSQVKTIQASLDTNGQRESEIRIVKAQVPMIHQ